MRNVTEVNSPTALPLHSFTWPKRIAEFVNGQTKSHRMSSFLPSMFLLLAGFLGASGFLATLHLLILFLVANYVTQKLRRVIPPVELKPVTVRHNEHQMRLAVSAGVGAVFAFKLFQAFWNPLNHESPQELVHEILTITLVSVGVILFIEPLAEGSRARLGLEEHHSLSVRQSWPVKFAVFAILALSSLAHGFLHKQIELEMDTNPVGTLIAILGTTLVSGGITYAWATGAGRQKPRAARFGFLTGAMVGLFVASLILSVTRPKVREEDTGMVEAANAVERGGSSSLPPEILVNATNNYRNPEVRGQLELDLRKMVLPWMILGLIGGLVVDRGRGSRLNCSIAMAIFATAILLFPACMFFAKWLGLRYLPLTWEEAIAQLLAVGGWALALVVFPFTDKVLGIRRSI